MKEDNSKGFLQVNNQIIDYWMARLTNAEFKTLLAIVRKTRGWNKPYDRISQPQMAELTGLTTRSVRTAIDGLLDKKLIIVTGDDSKVKLFAVNFPVVNDVKTDVTAMELALKDAEVISNNAEVISPSNDKDAEVISPYAEVFSKDAEVDFLHNIQTKDTITKDSIKSAYPFDDFWNLYDKKKDAGKCRKKWDKIKESDKKLIMEHLPDYIASTPDKQFRKNPMTYLNGEGWLDEIIKPQQQIKNQNLQPWQQTYVPPTVKPGSVKKPVELTDSQKQEEAEGLRNIKARLLL